VDDGVHRPFGYPIASGNLAVAESFDGEGSYFMTVAQGLYKKLAYKKQVGLGAPASGSGGQLLRRETATFNKSNATYTSDEITSYQQYTGDAYGPGQTAGRDQRPAEPQDLCRPARLAQSRSFRRIAAITSLSLTIAGSGPFTLTAGSAPS
jgi:hypothetical protein